MSTKNTNQKLRIQVFIYGSEIISIWKQLKRKFPKLNTTQLIKAAVIALDTTELSEKQIMAEFNTSTNKKLKALQQYEKKDTQKKGSKWSNCRMWG